MRLLSALTLICCLCHCASSRLRSTLVSRAISSSAMMVVLSVPVAALWKELDW